MNKIKHHINITLVCLNTVGLTTYCHHQTPTSSSLTFLAPFFLGLVNLPLKAFHQRSLYCIVSVLSLIAVFLPFSFISVLVASFGLGVSLALGYELTNQVQSYYSEMAVRLYEASLNISIALGVILSTMGSFLGITVISAKLLVLVCTLANFYLSTSGEYEKVAGEQRIRSKVSFTLVPFYMQTWTYSIGYSIGVYLNTFEILSPHKHGKYMVVSLLILIEILTYKDEVKMICQLLRASLVYHFEKNTKTVEMLFVVAFLLLRLFFAENNLNLFLMLGYGIIALSLWRNQYRDSGYYESREQGEDNSTEQNNELELQLIENEAPESSTPENRQTSKVSERKTSRLLK